MDYLTSIRYLFGYEVYWTCRSCPMAARTFSAYPVTWIGPTEYTCGSCGSCYPLNSRDLRQGREYFRWIP